MTARQARRSGRYSEWKKARTEKPQYTFDALDVFSPDVQPGDVLIARKFHRRAVLDRLTVEAERVPEEARLKVVLSKPDGQLVTQTVALTEDLSVELNSLGPANKGDTLRVMLEVTEDVTSAKGVLTSLSVRVQ